MLLDAGARPSPDGKGWALDRHNQATSDSATGLHGLTTHDSDRADKSASIGLLLEQHNASRRVYIKSLMPGGPAFLDARLKQGDRLLSVDGVSVHGMDLSHVFEMIKGPPGTEANHRPSCLSMCPLDSAIACAEAKSVWGGSAC